MLKFWIAIYFLSGYCEGTSFLTRPKNITVEKGAAAEFPCKVDFGTTVFQGIQWVFNDKRLYSFEKGHEDYSNVDKTFLVNQDGKNFNLTVRDLRFDDGGKYTCKILSDQATALLTVVGMPQISYDSVNAIEDSTSEFKCTAQFSGPSEGDTLNYPNLQMFFDGRLLNGTAPVPKYDSSADQFNIILVRNITLEVRMHAKKLVCGIGTSGPATHINASTEITVLYSVRDITYTPNHEIFDVGSNITCTAEGNPKPVFWWSDTQNKGDVINGAVLVIAEKMIGSNVWECTANNTINGKSHQKTVLATFDVGSIAKGYGGKSGIDSGKIAAAVIIPVLILFISLSAFLFYKRKRKTGNPEGQNRDESSQLMADNENAQSNTSTNRESPQEQLPLQANAQNDTADGDKLATTAESPSKRVSHPGGNENNNVSQHKDEESQPKPLHSQAKGQADTSKVSAEGNSVQTNAELAGKHLDVSHPNSKENPAGASLDQANRHNDTPNGTVENSSYVQDNAHHEIRAVNYFHGDLPKEQVQHLLTEDGDYLITSWGNADPSRYKLYYKWEEQISHVSIQYKERRWFFIGRYEYKTFPELEKKLCKRVWIKEKFNVSFKRAVARQGLEEDFRQTSAESGDEESTDVSDTNNEESSAESLHLQFKGQHDTSEVDDNAHLNEIRAVEWFHGVLSNEQVQKLLSEDGDFIVTKTWCKTNPSGYELSYRGEKQIKHVPLQYSKGKWILNESYNYPTIQDLKLKLLEEQLDLAGSLVKLKTAVEWKEWELRTEDVVVNEDLHNGNFGEIVSAKLCGQQTVVKLCEETQTDDEKKAFFEEVCLLQKYKHENIAKFHGIAVTAYPLIIVIETECEMLLEYLEKCRNRKKHEKHDVNKKLLQMCMNVSEAMCYLKSITCIHRDIAARNCVISKKKSIVKICNFFMAKEKEEYQADKKEAIQIRWAAPEVIETGKYTFESDVWSFGVLMWEIFTFGQRPYADETDDKLLAQKIGQGLRLQVPTDIPNYQALNKLLLKCWNKADRRPGIKNMNGQLHNFSSAL